MLSNAYFLAKFRFDTAENEPPKNLQNLLILNFSNFANPDLEDHVGGLPRVEAVLARAAGGLEHEVRRDGLVEGRERAVAQDVLLDVRLQLPGVERLRKPLPQNRDKSFSLMPALP